MGREPVERPRLDRHDRAARASLQRGLQKSVHNTFQKNEDLLDILLYHRVRSIEFDLQATKWGAGAPYGDWYLLHGDEDIVTNYDYASTALVRLAAFHRAVPRHEVVTLWVDHSIQNTPGHTAADFDTLLQNTLGSALFTPQDFLDSCRRTWTGPGAAPTDIPGLHAAIQSGACTWPALDDLRGRILVVITSGEGDYAAGNLAGRKAFVSRGVFGEADDVAFFYNLGGHELSRPEWELARTIDASHFVTRNYWSCTPSSIETPGSAFRCGTDAIEPWQTSVAYRFHHIATNYANDKTDWDRTHNARGYPFCPLGVTACDALVPRRDGGRRHAEQPHLVGHRGLRRPRDRHEHDRQLRVRARRAQRAGRLQPPRLDRSPQRRRHRLGQRLLDGAVRPRRSGSVLRGVPAGGQSQPVRAVALARL